MGLGVWGFRVLGFRALGVLCLFGKTGRASCFRRASEPWLLNEVAQETQTLNHALPSRYPPSLFLSLYLSVCLSIPPFLTLICSLSRCRSLSLSLSIPLSRSLCLSLSLALSLSLSLFPSVAIARLFVPLPHGHMAI